MLKIRLSSKGFQGLVGTLTCKQIAVLHDNNKMNTQSTMGTQKSQECLLFWVNWHMSRVLKDEEE